MTIPKKITIIIPRRILEWRGSTVGFDDASERLDALLLALTNKTSYCQTTDKHIVRTADS